MSKKITVLLGGCGHLDKGDAVSGTRHMMEAAARIARGKVLPLDV